MGKTSIELTSNGTAVLQQAVRPADKGSVIAVSIALLSGTAAYGSVFSRLSIGSRSGGNLLYIANLAAGYISHSSNINWTGFFPLGATNELVLDLWGTDPTAIIRATIVTDPGGQ